MRRGYFITFEGIDGCGKSTQAKNLADLMRRLNIPVFETREPGGTPISEKIRSLLIDPGNSEMVNECELLLYLAARSQHVREKIIPSLHSGKMVVCDRFQDATIAYQGFGRGISIDFLNSISIFAAGIIPDITFVLDIPVELACDRLKKIDKLQDRLESSGIDFFKKIRRGYSELAESNAERIVLIDGTLPEVKISEKISTILSERIGNFNTME